MGTIGNAISMITKLETRIILKLFSFFILLIYVTQIVCYKKGIRITLFRFYFRKVLLGGIAYIKIMLYFLEWKMLKLVDGYKLQIQVEQFLIYHYNKKEAM